MTRILEPYGDLIKVWKEGKDIIVRVKMPDGFPTSEKELVKRLSDGTMDEDDCPFHRGSGCMLMEMIDCPDGVAYGDYTCPLFAKVIE